jgi:hypothetical protein
MRTNRLMRWSCAHPVASTSSFAYLVHLHLFPHLHAQRTGNTAVLCSPSCYAVNREVAETRSRARPPLVLPPPFLAWRPQLPGQLWQPCRLQAWHALPRAQQKLPGGARAVARRGHVPIGHGTGPTAAGATARAGFCGLSRRAGDLPSYLQGA